MFGVNLEQMAKGELAHIDFNHNGIPDIQEAQTALAKLEVEAEAVVAQLQPIVALISPLDVAADLAKFQTFAKLTPTQVQAFSSAITRGMQLISEIPTALKKLQAGITAVTGK